MGRKVKQFYLLDESFFRVGVCKFPTIRIVLREDSLSTCWGGFFHGTQVTTSKYQPIFFDPPKSWQKKLNPHKEKTIRLFKSLHIIVLYSFTWVKCIFIRKCSTQSLNIIRTKLDPLNFPLEPTMCGKFALMAHIMCIRFYYF